MGTTINTEILLISAGIVASLVAVYILIFKIPVTENRYVASNDIKLAPKLKRLVRLFGPDILGIVNARQDRSKYAEIDLLLRRAGNPWNLTIEEFILTRYVLAFVGSITGAVLMFVIADGFFSAIVMIALPTYVGYLYPKIKYSSAEKDRELEFIKTLPNAVDLLSMAISGGNYTLKNSIEKVVVYLEPSPIKDEFIRIYNDTEAGKSMTEALNGFAERVPTDSVKAFIKTLNNANELSVDMNEILEVQSKVSRDELKRIAELKIQSLPAKILLVLAPTSLASVVAIIVAPMVSLFANFV